MENRLILRKIYDDCPKAFEQFYKWAGYVFNEDHEYSRNEQIEQMLDEYLFPISDGSFIASLYVRELYDFFDKHNIYMSIHPLKTFEEPYFMYTVLNDNKVLENNHRYDNRIDAEHEAFKYCFTLLEEKI